MLDFSYTFLEYNPRYQVACASCTSIYAVPKGVDHDLHDFFRKPAFLTVSAHLGRETYARTLSDVLPPKATSRSRLADIFFPILLLGIPKSLLSCYRYIQLDLLSKLKIPIASQVGDMSEVRAAFASGIW